MTELIIEEGKPSTFVHDEIKEIRQFAKNPKRVITKVGSASCTGPARPLGYKEIGAVEEKMIQSGQDIKPRFSKEGKMVNAIIENRLCKLYDVIKECVESKGYFNNEMLRKDAILHDRITLSKAYLKGSIAADLKKLVKRGLIYCRGGHRFLYYYLGPNPVDEKPPAGPSEVQPESKEEICKGVRESLIPEHIVIDVNVKISWK